MKERVSLSLKVLYKLEVLMMEKHSIRRKVILAGLCPFVGAAFSPARFYAYSISFRWHFKPTLKKFSTPEGEHLEKSAPSNGQSPV
jgi:hypothetical protein